MNQGDKVSYPSGTGHLITETPDVNGIVIVQDESGEYRRVALSIVRKYSPNEQAITKIQGDIELMDGILSGRTVESYDIASHLFKMNYRKIEALSFNEFKETISSYDAEASYKMLTMHNHIAAKDMI